MANNSYKNPSMKQLDILKSENETGTILMENNGTT